MLNSTAAAEHHLYKTLMKTKAIAEHPDLPSQVRTASKPTTNTATLNVVARLCKSNQAKTALDAAVIDIQRALGVDPASVPAAQRQRKRVKSIKKSAESKDHELRPNNRKAPDKRSQSFDQTPDSTAENDTDSNAEPDKGRAKGSPDELGEEYSDMDDLEQRLLNEAAEDRRFKSKSKSEKYDIQADLSLSDSGSAGMSASPEPQKALATKKTSFLPSLTMGGYISGSDSEAEDIDIAPKRNRRGQRARQQIWEQKYGNNAKHLQKQGHAIEFDRKRGAVDKNGRSRGNSGHDRRRNVDSKLSRDQGDDLATSRPVKTAHRDDGGALHPSWEAAKKAKEKKETPVAFSGKKITFD